MNEEKDEMTTNVEIVVSTLNEVQKSLPPSIMFVAKALDIMHRDAELVSCNEGTYFWNEDSMMGLNGQDRQNFNIFHGKESITADDLFRLRVCKNDDNDDLEKLFTNHAEMTECLRKALSDNPVKEDHKKLIFATQFSFMLIMWATFKRYNLY